MLPEIGATELMVIAAVALIVVGPKDLPVLLRKVGRFMAKLRGMAAEFRASFDEMARQSELDELRKEVEALRQGRLLDPINADIDQSFRSMDEDLRPNAVMLPVTETGDPGDPELHRPVDLAKPAPTEEPVEAPSDVEPVREEARA